MFLICKGQTSRIDLSTYQTTNKSYTSFLTFSWAIIADVDIESECIRFMGSLRMDLWAGTSLFLFLASVIQFVLSNQYAISNKRLFQFGES
jgi:hypothetical protein